MCDSSIDNCKFFDDICSSDEGRNLYGQQNYIDQDILLTTDKYGNRRFQNLRQVLFNCEPDRVNSISDYITTKLVMYSVDIYQLRNITNKSSAIGIVVHSTNATFDIFAITRVYCSNLINVFVQDKDYFDVNPEL